jgi:hypothetical protein
MDRFDNIIDDRSLLEVNERLFNDEGIGIFVAKVKEHVFL